MKEPPSAGMERLITMISLRLNYSIISLNPVAVYAPTLNSSVEAKEQFCSEIVELIGLDSCRKQSLYLLE